MAGTARTGRTGRTGWKLIPAVLLTLMVVGGGLVASAPATGALSLVTLSGTFSLDGTPVPNVPVDFNGSSDGQSVNISTSTDASGNWTLHPLAGSVGTLAMSDWIISAHVALTVGSSDQVEDVDLPTAPVTDDIQVVDGNGDPVPGATVDGSAPGNTFTTTTSDGSVVTWGDAASSPPGAPLCTTDASGSCTLTTYDGMAGTFVAALGFTGTATAIVTDPYGSDTSYPTTFTGQVTGTVESDPESTTIVVDWTHSLVDLTGTATMAGTPVSGATVTFDGLTTTTGADGTYTLHPFKDSSGTLTVASGASTTSQQVSVGDHDTEVDVALPPPAAPGDGITLSGTVNFGPYTFGGVTVSLGDLTTTTNADGQYSLQPAPGTTGTLEADLDYGGVPVFATAPVVVGTSDQTDDINVPIGFGTVDVSLVDSSGDPLAGERISGQVPSQTAAVTGTTSDGSTVTWGVGPYTGPEPPPNMLCMTGSDGTCTYQAAIGLEETLTTTVSPFGSDPSYPSEVTASMTTAPTQSTTDVTFTVPTGSVVALSGTVTLNGHVLSGVNVSLGGIETTTDADGDYVLHPFAGTTGNLTVSDGAFTVTSAVAVGDQDQEDDVVASDPGTVLLSGSVLMDGSAVPYGQTVTFDGFSTSTDASGDYSMFVPSDVDGQLTTRGVYNSSSALTTGSVDLTDDLTIPSAPVTATAQAVDGSGSPLSGMNINIVDAGNPSPVTDTTSTGDTLTWWTISYSQSCVTDATGTCTLPLASTNIPVTLSGNEQLVPGDPSYPTISASASTVVPSDGSTMTLSFPNVSSLPSAGTASGSVLVAAGDATTIQDASSSPVSSSLLPDGLEAPVGADLVLGVQRPGGREHRRLRAAAVRDGSLGHLQGAARRVARGRHLAGHDRREHDRPAPH